MLVLLHVPSGNYIKFQSRSLLSPILDLEFAYKYMFYNKKITCSFLAWLEKLKAKIIAGNTDNKIIFNKNNPFLKGIDVFMVDFEIIVISDIKQGPNMDIDITKCSVVE